jgi:hypothetical protein
LEFIYAVDGESVRIRTTLGASSRYLSG